MRANSISALLVATLALVLGRDVSAHRHDEFLHAARIAVEADRVHLELSLTPGIAVADIVMREIDGDGDGVWSTSEQRTYAARVLEAMTLRVDGDTISPRLAVASSSFPEVAAMRNGEGMITIESNIDMALLSAGTHRLYFRNGNAAPNVVYLANALVPPDDRVTVTAQRRDVEQRELTMDFEVRGTPAARGDQWAQLGKLGWLGLAGSVILARPLMRRKKNLAIWRSGHRAISIGRSAHRVIRRRTLSIPSTLSALSSPDDPIARSPDS